MDCVALFPIWAQPVIASPSFGAAQFVAANDSTIQLTSRLPNIFGNDGDYVEFKIFQEEIAEGTVFGSTVSPDAIVIDGDTITITDGENTDSLTMAESISASAFTHIRLIRNGTVIECWRAEGSDNLVQEVQTLDVVPLDIDLVGKNQAAYDDVYAIQFRSAERGYLSKASPSTLQGDGGEWFGKIAFTLNEAGNHCLIDSLSGGQGYRVEVVNKYLSTHIIRWTVDDNDPVDSDDVNESWVFYIGDTVEIVLDIEDLGETEPGEGDITFTGDWSPNSGTVYVGSQAASSKFAGLKLHQLITGNTGLSSSQRTFLLTAAFDEITVSSTVATSDCTNAYIFDETSGTRADSVGDDDLTENPGAVYSAASNNGGFETLDGAGGFTGWTTAVAGSSTMNIESSDVHDGTYSARFDIDASASTVSLTDSTYRLDQGMTYDVSIYAKFTGTLGSAYFNFDADNFNQQITFTSNDWAEYTTTRNAGDGDGRTALLAGPTCSSESVYFDNFTMSAQYIRRVDGMNRSHLNAASFTGYLRDVSLVSGAFAVTLPLYTDANDTSGDGNDGTATSITWATEDPTAA